MTQLETSKDQGAFKQAQQSINLPSTWEDGKANDKVTKSIENGGLDAVVFGKNGLGIKGRRKKARPDKVKKKEGIAKANERLENGEVETLATEQKSTTILENEESISEYEPVW
eukprot:CAMPEP_0114662676 /NCGR_PEP_ID=MMETSP0191-20121206/25333_1 /TAXON_ID=126664 /ORGANISM="Sorites sp." /LENGTH=112 /DNA_ID=CAMNT_0001899631 /DNA_START=983 /DNA_END=1318 /DNA_ORIENTATION=-